MFHTQSQIRHNRRSWLPDGAALVLVGFVAWLVGRLSKDDAMRESLLQRVDQYRTQFHQVTAKAFERMRPETTKEQIVDVEEALQPGG